jgi:hypothetical protein
MILPTANVPPESLEMRMMREIQKGLQAEFDKVLENIVADAKQQFEKELRAALGSVVCKLSSYYSVERVGGNLMIMVKLEDKR